MIDEARLEQELEELVHGAVEIGRFYADYAFKDHMRKVILAQLKEEARIEDPKLTDGKAEDKARVHKRYRDHLIALGKAQAALETARARRQGILAKAEVFRTQQANTRGLR